VDKILEEKVKLLKMETSYMVHIPKEWLTAMTSQYGPINNLFLGKNHVLVFRLKPPVIGEFLIPAKLHDRGTYSRYVVIPHRWLETMREIHPSVPIDYLLMSIQGDEIYFRVDDQPAIPVAMQPVEKQPVNVDSPPSA
jgi:hypothetical protein